MQGDDQRRQFAAFDILEFVHEQRERPIFLARRFADRPKQIDQIALEIAGIGKAGLGRDIDAQLDVFVCQSNRAHETGQRAPCAAHLRLCGLGAVERDQRRAQMPRQHGGQGAPFRRFERRPRDAAGARVRGDAA